MTLLLNLFLEEIVNVVFHLPTKEVFRSLRSERDDKDSFDSARKR